MARRKKKKKALLLGNGLNRLSRDFSWEDLIRQLIDYVSPPRAIDIGDKPFPLLYEEITLGALTVERKEEELKRWIAREIETITPNPSHKQVLECGVSDVLTTNYDYSLEQTASAAGLSIEILDSAERKYSFFRRRKLGDDLTVWHIHGERDSPESILLGYDQYSGYLERMRTYVNSGRDGSPGPIQRLGLKDAPPAQSWIDLMFTSNVYVLGLTLSYVELHLWWLLTYRARLKALEEYPISNKVVFIYPDFLKKSLADKVQLLDGIEVRSRKIDVSYGAWQKFYREALEFVRKD